MKTRIQITGKNWNDIIALPCFRKLIKGDSGVMVVVIAKHPQDIHSPALTIADVGDWIETTDGGKTWERSK